MKKSTFKEFVRSGNELRDLFAYAKLYINGEGNVAILCGYSSQARSVTTHPDIVELLDEWVSMANRAWNEWGLADEPISEDELREWITKQLEHSETIPYP